MEEESLRALAAYSEVANLLSRIAVKSGVDVPLIQRSKNLQRPTPYEEHEVLLEAALYRVSQSFTLLKTISCSPLEIGLIEEVRTIADEIQNFFLLQSTSLVKPSKTAIIIGERRNRKRPRGEVASESKRPTADQNQLQNSVSGKAEGEPFSKEMLETIRAISPESNPVRFEALAGVDDAIRSLRNVVLTPLLYPHWFTGKRRPIHSVLLYGPPGTGKTALANAAAKAAGAYLISLSASDLLSKYVGESEKAIRDAFTQVSARTRRQQRVVLFLDEVDALCSKRGAEGESESARRVKTEFLIQLNQLNSITLSSSSSSPKTSNGTKPKLDELSPQKPTGRCIVLAATNLPWDLDSAFRRRFDQMIYIPLPNAEGRLQMLRNALGIDARDLTIAEFPTPQQSRCISSPAIHCLTHDDLVDVAQRLEGYSGSDIQHVVAHALMQPVLKAQAATTFQKIPQTDKWIPVTPSATTTSTSSNTTVVQTALAHFRADQVELPPIIKQDLLAAISLYPKTVSGSEIQRFLEWK